VSRRTNPFSPRERMDGYWRYVLECQLQPDPLAGVMSLRAWATSGYGSPRPWHWDPGQHGQQLHLHGDGWTSATAGTVGEARETEELRELTALGLTGQELQVMRERYYPAQGRLTDETVAERLGLTLSQVRRAVESALRKARERAHALQQLGSGCGSS